MDYFGSVSPKLLNCLEILGQNETYNLYFLSGADIYRRYKQIQHFSKTKCNIARNIMSFFMNVIIKILSAIQPILFIRFNISYIYCFEAGIYAQIYALCLKLRYLY